MFRVHYVLWAACLLLLPSCSRPVGQVDARLTVTVLVAKKPINAWTLIHEPESFFVARRLSAHLVPKRAIGTFEEVKGGRVNRPVGEGVIVTVDDLVRGKALEELDGRIAPLPPGPRAMTVPVALRHFSPLPGSRVNVVATICSAGKRVSKTIQENVLVLKVDTTSCDDPEWSGRSCLVTLAVFPQAAQRLHLATALGVELHLEIPSDCPRTTC
jgi:Flp pilus assembly protein CpaB